jgi:hypothetical protein
MRGGHALRGMVTAWLGLIVLQTVSTQGGSGRVAGAFADANALLKRALDPSVPAIPDRRDGAKTSYWSRQDSSFTPAPSGSTIAGAHPGAQINPSTGAVIGYGY